MAYTKKNPKMKHIELCITAFIAFTAGVLFYMWLSKSDAPYGASVQKVTCDFYYEPFSKVEIRNCEL